MNSILAMALIAWSFPVAAANPSQADIDYYKARMILYQAAGQTPLQVANSLSKYFGKTFEAEWLPNEEKTEIRIVIGSGNKISFMQVIGNI